MYKTLAKYSMLNKREKDHNSPKVLLVNPWIHDFAAYDFWAKPLGLLTLASILRTHNIQVSYIDCLDRHHPFSKTNSNSFRHGRGHYIKTHISKPDKLKDIPRNYCRYGILPSWFEQDLKNIDQPDIVLVSSMMTYWYPGTKETITTVKNIYPDVPVILGGIYPSLCKKHAIENSGADHVVTGPGESVIISLISKITGWLPSLNFNYCDLDTYPIPAFDLQHKIEYITILTRRGCPYNCTYCASNFLQPKIMQRSYQSVLGEILHWYKHHKVVNFVFYDDALLLDSDNHIVPILEKIIKSEIRVKFHTPNAVHIREVSGKVAKLMFAAGFHTIRLGLETANFQNRHHIDKKVRNSEFQQAIKHLINAGFKNSQIGVYLLVGLPNQNIKEVINSINIVKKAKLKPVLAHYSPIPYTSMWTDAVTSSRYDLEDDPIFTNNAISPCTSSSFSWKILSKLKQIAKK